MGQRYDLKRKALEIHDVEEGMDSFARPARQEDSVSSI